SRRQRARGAGGAGRNHNGADLLAPMQGTIVTVAIEEGDEVSQGDLICVLEAMKMENHLLAHRDGRVTGVSHTAGDAVERGAVLATIADA
ncbi:MAG: acetyl-CoA carboxylase biotin carboxyl carrier protein subunit, partial [Nitriliruptor sp.]